MKFLIYVVLHELNKNQHTHLLHVLLSVHTQLVFSTLFVDVNNDGFLDEQELEALFTKEVKKKEVQILNLFQ